MRFYHGGALGLTEILPPAQTGADTFVDYLERLYRSDPSVRPELFSAMVCQRDDKVSITSDLVVARAYAGWRVGRGEYGCVYEVEPRGEPEPDPHIPASFLADSARVVRVHSIIPERDRGKYVRARFRKYPPETFRATEAERSAISARLGGQPPARAGAGITSVAHRGKT